MNKVHYIFIGQTMLDLFGLTRQSYIGKEKEPENNLGDHGVRKYDYETGRFNSIDPLFEKYYGWSPYQYSMNNPIWAKDWNGRDIIVLLDKEGASNAGHAAMLIGNDTKGWELISKNGGEYGIIGPSKNPQLGASDKNEFNAEYKTLNDFVNDDNERQTRYDIGFRISSNDKQDAAMSKAGKKAADSWYFLNWSNCMDAVNAALKAGGFNTKVKIEKIGRKYGELYEEAYQMLLPNDQYNLIKNNNSGYELDFQKEREK